MSENDEKNVRRFGRRNQKNKLEKPSSLFPVDESDFVPDFDREKANFDFDKLNLPDNDAEALAMLSSLRDEVKAPVITPKAERYPPIAPKDRPQPKKVENSSAKVGVAPPNRGKNIFYNFLTLFFIGATCALVFWFVQVWNDPQSILNPLPPDTPFVVITADPNTVQNDAVQVDATPDESGQIFVVITDTPVPTVDATESPFPFIAEPVLYAPNSNELGCNWWSIAGTVTDFNGEPLSGYRIRIIGEELTEAVFSGASQAFGEGGYELPLIGTPREAAFVVQLFSAQDAPLSEEVFVSTRADCDGNVTLVNFVQNR